MAEFQLRKIPAHVAFIMDGNGRWAKARGLARHFGHKEACLRLREIFDTCLEYGISYSSYYAFSTENWDRPQEEIDHLMDYLEEFFERDLPYIKSKGGRIVISGDLGRIREKTRKTCFEAMDSTKDNSTHTMNICLNYGGRDEIVRAAKAFVRDVEEGKVAIDDLTDESFKNYLWNPALPDVDLMIRTSGEVRLSNFMLYRLAYAELVFVEVKWPDFRRPQFLECLKEFQKRDRRFGGLENE